MSSAIIFQARIAIEDHKDEVTTVIPLTPRSLSWFDLHSTVCWHCDRRFDAMEEETQKMADEPSSDDDSEGEGEDESEDEDEDEDNDNDDADDSSIDSSSSSSGDDGEDDDDHPDTDPQPPLRYSRPPLPFILKVNTYEAADASGVVREMRAYTADGYFCSFQCAKAWGLENGFKSNPSITNNALFYKDVVKDGTISQYLKIRAAPPRRALRKYGGPLSYDEFDHFTSRITFEEPIIQLQTYPTISMRHQYLEEIRFENIDSPHATNTIILEQNNDIINRRKRKRMSLIMSPSHLNLNNRMQELQRRSRQL